MGGRKRRRGNKGSVVVPAGAVKDGKVVVDMDGVKRRKEDMGSPGGPAGPVENRGKVAVDREHVRDLCARAGIRLEGGRSCLEPFDCGSLSVAGFDYLHGELAALTKLVTVSKGRWTRDHVCDFNNIVDRLFDEYNKMESEICVVRRRYEALGQLLDVVPDIFSVVDAEVVRDVGTSTDVVATTDVGVSTDVVASVDVCVSTDVVTCADVGVSTGVVTCADVGVSTDVGSGEGVGFCAMDVGIDGGVCAGVAGPGASDSGVSADVGHGECVSAGAKVAGIDEGVRAGVASSGSGDGAGSGSFAAVVAASVRGSDGSWAVAGRRRRDVRPVRADVRTDGGRAGGCNGNDRSSAPSVGRVADGGIKVLIRNVCTGVSVEEFLRELYERNLEDVMSYEEFERDGMVRLDSAPWEKASGYGGYVNVVLRGDRRIMRQLLDDGRVDIFCWTYRTSLVDPVPHCFRCLGFDHRVRECRARVDICRRCGEGGHRSPDCVNAVCCRNCRLRGLPSAHGMFSRFCPVYVALLDRALARH